MIRKTVTGPAQWVTELVASGVRGWGNQVYRFAKLEPAGGPLWVGVLEDGRQVGVFFESPWLQVNEQTIKCGLVATQEHDMELLFVLGWGWMPHPVLPEGLEEVHVLPVWCEPDLLGIDYKVGVRESFWLLGEPVVEVEWQDDLVQIMLSGLRLWDIEKRWQVVPAGARVPLWGLDENWDGRVFTPKQMFAPWSGKKSHTFFKPEARPQLRGLDPTWLKSTLGYASLPFKPGGRHCGLVQAVDNRGVVAEAKVVI